MDNNDKIQENDNKKNSPSFLDFITTNVPAALVYFAVSLFIMIKAVIYNGEGEHLFIGFIATINCLFGFMALMDALKNRGLKGYKTKLKNMSTEDLERELKKYYEDAAIGILKQNTSKASKRDSAHLKYQNTLLYGEAVREELKKRGKNYKSVEDAGLEAYILAGSPVPKEPEKEASVIKSAVAGGVIAGPAGAVVGAIHAADKNNRTANEKKTD